MVMKRLMRPMHVPGIGARTPEEYRERQRLLMQKTGNSDPVEEVSDAMAAHVGAGAWRVRCLCGEAPPADPEWQLACCSGCGRIYTHVEFPAEIDEIERLLSLRPNQATRNWQLPETIADLYAENLGHGVRV